MGRDSRTALAAGSLLNCRLIYSRIAGIMVKGVRKFKVPEACDHKSDSFGIRETRTKKGTRIDKTTGSSERNGRNEEMFITKAKEEIITRQATELQKRTKKL